MEQLLIFSYDVEQVNNKYVSKERKHVIQAFLKL